MDLIQIGLFCFRAVCFALPCAAVFSLLRLWALRRKEVPVRRRREALFFAFIFYLAALLQLTIWRGGPDWAVVFSPTPRMRMHLTPLDTTMALWRMGLRPFLYNVVGNIVWFCPLGAVLRCCKRRVNLFQGMAVGLTLSLFIEFSQWILQTGVTDIDDLIFNTLGTALGFLLAPAALRARQTEDD